MVVSFGSETPRCPDNRVDNQIPLSHPIPLRPVPILPFSHIDRPEAPAPSTDFSPLNFESAEWTAPLIRMPDWEPPFPDYGPSQHWTSVSEDLFTLATQDSLNGGSSYSHTVPIDDKQDTQTVSWSFSDSNPMEPWDDSESESQDSSSDSTYDPHHHHLVLQTADCGHDDFQDPYRPASHAPANIKNYGQKKRGSNRTRIRSEPRGKVACTSCRAAKKRCEVGDSRGCLLCSDDASLETMNAHMPLHAYAVGIQNIAARTEEDLSLQVWECINPNAVESSETAEAGIYESYERYNI
ncbi:hypothetical protein SISNIDRAFT_471591 [Sistotremastrum niveocremeum HHB9708]|uniref:Uncharacterized protein n=1 Tax=Sistotremastrum niveocremeum HHB9708 TaxID=1314777 RepID=A0A164MFI2_9AGAM|nr:hypothetical protein SISNIDRAFT_471591 [Sistotremastrum niveocremeum HHB9708]